MSIFRPKSWRRSKNLSSTSNGNGIVELPVSAPAPDPSPYIMQDTIPSSSAPTSTKRGSVHQQPQNVPKISTANAPAPPAYAPTSPVDGFRDRSGEDPLEILREYDTVFLIDDSSSMKGRRWNEARTSLMGVADIAARYDQDGIDVKFLNSRKEGNGMRTGNQVMQLFEAVKPSGATPTGQRLENILREYMQTLERGNRTSSLFSSSRNPGTGNVKPMNLIVITDGAPTDDPESVIITFAKRLDKGEYPLSQVGIQFLQVGDDPSAKEALQELDDGLSDKHDIRDMVDTVPYCGQQLTAEVIVKTLIGGINRRMDRKSS
ncbi:hypothetical protein I302_109036 [Kwoniella bestiolae CBS 10118]|uniref:VWFA domain-containing protein n=1 Tax=Kwoniella bestiolae CBS 10118 TaxID=1296100 RepID=A0A1B9FUT1_9TREE|nr:hypothetical protein I302_08180 [Kwoniella bestiolae CBS 10118]OCF22530.1 hypothetical protein I302_08180 [Kwoniella bestiolae CBS 10118]